MPECRNASAEALKIFEHAGRLTINHPNLVLVHACGLTEDGAPWLAMEYLEDALSLSNVLKQEPRMTLDRIVHLFRSICDALAYVHSKGEVHFNVKPTNIMIVRHEGEADSVNLTDFGIGKISLKREMEIYDDRLPRYSSALYMSPEQFQGQRIHAQSDVYSIGCMLYESLSGKPPLVGMTLLDTMDRHLREPPVPISDAAPQVPPRLANVVMRYLHKEPARRYRTAEDLRNALDKVFNPGDPSSIILPSVPQAGSQLARKEHPMFYVTFLLSAALLDRHPGNCSQHWT
jgi:serine/threonine-protein kinase